MNLPHANPTLLPGWTHDRFRRSTGCAADDFYTEVAGKERLLIGRDPLWLLGSRPF